MDSSSQLTIAYDMLHCVKLLFFPLKQFPDLYLL